MRLFPLAPAFALAAAFLAAPPLGAGTPRIAVTAGARDFLAGETKGVAVSADGRLMLGAALAARAWPDDANDAAVFGAAADSSGRVFVATGGGLGRLFVSSDAKVTLLFTAPEPNITAVAVAPDGLVVCASSPNGKIYRVDPKADGSRESRHRPRRAERGRDLGARVREGRNALRRHGEQGPRLSQGALGRPRALPRNRGRAREGARRGSRRHRVRGHVGPRSRGRAARSGQPAHAARFLAPGGLGSRRGRPRRRLRGGIAARRLDGPAGAGRAGPSAHAHADAGALGARGGGSARLRVGVRLDVSGAAFRRAPFHEQLGNRRHSARRLRRARLALSRGVDFRPASRRGRSAPRRDGPARARVRVEGPPRAPRGLDR